MSRLKDCRYLRKMYVYSSGIQLKGHTWFGLVSVLVVHSFSLLLCSLLSLRDKFEASVFFPWAGLLSRFVRASAFSFSGSCSISRNIKCELFGRDDEAHRSRSARVRPHPSPQ